MKPKSGFAVALAAAFAFGACNSSNISAGQNASTGGSGGSSRGDANLSDASSGSGGGGGGTEAGPTGPESACNPLAPPPITLGAVVGVGKDVGGTLYVDAEHGVFVSGGGELTRQNVVGSGQSGSNEFMFLFVPPGDGVSQARSLLVETQGSTADKMGLGPADSKAFLSQSPPGVTMLALVDPSSVSGMALANTPNVISYLGDVANGDVVLATMPMNDSDWNPNTGGLFIFYGPTNDVAQRKITRFNQDGGGFVNGTVTFLVGDTPYVLAFHSLGQALDAGQAATLTPQGGTPMAVTLRSPTPTALPANLSFTCFETNDMPCVHTTTDDSLRRDSDTLPQGPCAANAPVCNLIVRDPCPCVNAQVPRKFYSCSCQSGSWHCALTSQDAGMCAASMPGCVYADGGSASARDASSD